MFGQLPVRHGLSRAGASHMAGSMGAKWGKCFRWKGQQPLFIPAVTLDAETVEGVSPAGVELGPCAPGVASAVGRYHLLPLSECELCPSFPTIITTTFGSNVQSSRTLRKL